MITTLIVDDESDVRALVRLTVEMANNGLEVTGEAADGAEALERWRAERPVVVILDHRMPGMSGLEVAELMLAENPDQKIILFSAFLDAETAAEAQRVGVVRCLEKTAIAQLPGTLWSLAESA
jgi:YesN/AraC family two-component response regulator